MSKTMKSILIASSSYDDFACKPVAENLTKRGFDVCLYEADKVSDGSVPMIVGVNKKGFNVRYACKRLRLPEFSAAWFRRPHMYGLNHKNKAKQYSLDAERNRIQYTLWDAVPQRVWLNAPKNLYHAEHKLSQLIIACEVGFAIPDTVVANTWQPIVNNLPAHVVYKPSFSSFSSDRVTKFVYTKPFHNKVSDLPMKANPYPGFWQTRLRKAREWRITVVGNVCFDAAIYTDKDAKDDWRLHQGDQKVRFERGSFPDDQKAKCFRYLERFGLRFGAFDFVEDHKGNITFLECNPNGQYGWLETELNYPISEAIGDELVRIANGG